MTSLYLKIVFLHFIFQTDPSDGAYNMAPEQNRVWLHHAHSWLHTESSDSAFSHRDDMGTDVYLDPAVLLPLQQPISVFTDCYIFFLFLLQRCHSFMMTVFIP